MKKTAFTVLALIAMSVQASAQGAYVEFKLSSSAESGMSGSTRVYYRDGNTRSELTMAAPQMPGGTMSQVSLILKDNPQKAYLLNEKAKTYTEVDLTRTSATEKDPSQYDVTVVGREKVNGYNCTHVKVKLASATTPEDIWVSTEVPNFKQYMSVKSKYTTEGLFKALAAKGAAGFIVRVLVNEHGRNIQVDLVKCETRTNDLALFSLDGYKKQESAAAAGSTPAELQEMAKKMQSMTPEERQQFIDQLRKQQQENPGSPTTYPH